MTDVTAPSAFHIMAKPTGAVCNLACDYCFFLAKDQLYPDSTFRMSEEVLEAYLRQLFEAHRVPQVTVWVRSEIGCSRQESVKPPCMASEGPFWPHEGLFSGR